jgi:hypothetical protein
MDKKLPAEDAAKVIFSRIITDPSQYLSVLRMEDTPTDSHLGTLVIENLYGRPWRSTVKAWNNYMHRNVYRPMGIELDTTVYDGFTSEIVIEHLGLLVKNHFFPRSSKPEQLDDL